jgi:hypothetical protein
MRTRGRSIIIDHYITFQLNPNHRLNVLAEKEIDRPSIIERIDDNIYVKRYRVKGISNHLSTEKIDDFR